VVRCDRQRELRALKRIRLGDSLTQRTAARFIRELANDIDDLPSTTESPPSTPRSPSCWPNATSPSKTSSAPAPTLAATIIVQAGDVRRFRDAGAFARFCGAAPIPYGSGQTTGRHRLHRGGNRQLNAALYRIAIVQQRHQPRSQDLPRPQNRGRQDRPRSPPRPQAPPRQRDLPPPPSLGQHHPALNELT
jgi:transposase IS116/IS110/IS902 family protein